MLPGSIGTLEDTTSTANYQIFQGNLDNIKRFMINHDLPEKLVEKVTNQRLLTNQSTTLTAFCGSGVELLLVHVGEETRLRLASPEHACAGEPAVSAEIRYGVPAAEVDHTEIPVL